MQKPKRILYASRWWLEDQMSCVAHEAAQRHWHINFQMCVTSELPNAWEGDGIITTFGAPLDEEATFLARANCPAVALNQYHPDMDIPYVSLDMGITGRLAAAHFIERGFHSFAHYTRESWKNTQLPYLPFERAINEAGGSVHRLIWPEEKDGWGESWEDRQRWLRKRLRRLPHPLAVLAVEPLSAVEIIEAALEEELDVPNDVAVLGLFDIHFYRQSTTIPLSCIIQDFSQHAHVACDLLEQMMEGEPPPTEPILLPPAGIATRGSTDTIAARHPAVAKATHYMLSHFADPIKVDYLADLCGQSRTRLYELFEEDLGISPHAVLTRIRLDRAKRMLRETDAKVRAVADACGFSSSVNLHRHFKKDLGMTPAGYRKQQKKKQSVE